MKRIGVLVPRSNCIIESELYRIIHYKNLLSNHVSIHFSRLNFRTRYATDRNKYFEELINDVPKAVARLKIPRIKNIGFFCTSAISMLQTNYDNKPIEWNLEKTDLISPPTAIINALKHINIKNITIFSPYEQEFCESFIQKFLINSGFRISDSFSFGLSKGEEIIDFGFNALQRHIVNNCPLDTDVILILCTNLPTFHLINEIENLTGKPVITSNQAMIWELFKRENIRTDMLSKFGKVFTKSAKKKYDD